MAKGNSKQPGKEPKSKKGSGKPARGKKGSPMFKLLFLAALIGVGYAAYTVRWHGHTAVERGVAYVETNVHFQSPLHWGDDTKPAAKKGHDAVADRRHAPATAGTHAPAEQISQSDKDALNRLIP